MKENVLGHIGNTPLIKYSEAPITVFTVKDRVLKHNPLCAIYEAESSYKDKLFGNNFTRSSFDYYGEANYDNQDEE